MIYEDKIANLMLMLVSAGYRRGDIHEIVRVLGRSSPSELDQLISIADSLRREMRKGFSSIGFETTYESTTRAERANASGVGRKVQVLMREAGLTNVEAVNAISSQLRQLDRSKAKLIPSYSKKSLASWVERVAEWYAPSDILHTATLLRNNRVHGVPLDWVLRKNES